MKRTVKIIILTLAFIATVLMGLYLYKKELPTYALVSSSVALVLLITLITYIINTRNEEAIYNSTLKKVLNNYDAILVESHNFPNLKGKNIIKVTNIDDLVDAQIEIRKPIYYMIEGDNSCSFVLLDNNEACIYILKQNEEVESPLELIINEYEKNNDIDESLLEDIEKTTIIKLNNTKSYKVSPYKKNTENKEEKNIDNKEETNKMTEEIKEETNKPKEKELKQENIEKNEKEQSKKEQSEVYIELL